MLNNFCISFFGIIFAIAIDTCLSKEDKHFITFLIP